MTTKKKTVTRVDVERLKQVWLKDPCWDLELSEGFEEFNQELLLFRLDTEKTWEKTRFDALTKFAEACGIGMTFQHCARTGMQLKAGVFDTIKLAEKLFDMQMQLNCYEQEIIKLDKKIKHLDGRVKWTESDD